MTGVTRARAACDCNGFGKPGCEVGVLQGQVVWQGGTVLAGSGCDWVHMGCRSMWLLGGLFFDTAGCVEGLWCGYFAGWAY